MGEDAGKVLELVDEINEAVQEQTKGIEQVTLGIREMDNVVQKNAANAEESASAAEELNALVEQTSNVILDINALIGGDREELTQNNGNNGTKQGPQTKVSGPTAALPYHQSNPTGCGRVPAALKGAGMKSGKLSSSTDSEGPGNF